MKISIVTGPWFPVPPFKGGAVERRWHGLAEEFASRGHQVAFLCRTYPGQPYEETINGVKYIRRSGFPQSQSIGLDLLKDLVYALFMVPALPRADILIISDFWLPVFAAVLRPNAGQIVIHAGRFPKWQYFLYEGAAQFIGPSVAIQEAIARQYPAAIPRLRVIPTPTNTYVFSPPSFPRSLREDKTILYTGRIHPEKGVHLLLDAFALLSKQLPQVRLQILGPVKESQGGGGESYLRSLQTKAQGLSVEFPEAIFDLSKLAKVYQSADLFCYPSLAEKGESFGLAPLEAMATGLVPIVSDLACFKDFIKEGKTGYFFNHRSLDAVKNLSATLTSAILNWEITCQMGVRAAEKAKEFSYERIADLYLADFEELLKKEFKNADTITVAKQLA